jgi:plasmid maintenance system antidote protein VapI
MSPFSEIKNVPFRRTPELWLALQSRHDLDRIGRARRAEIAAIPTLAASSRLQAGGETWSTK